MKKIWNLSHNVVAPVVTGAIEVTSRRLKDCLKKLDLKSSILLLQKAGLLGTANIVKTSPRYLRLLEATCSLGNVPEIPTIPK